MDSTRAQQQTDETQNTSSKKNTTAVYKKLLTNPAFLFLWLAQLFSQIGFNAANYGIIIIVTEVTKGSSFMVGLAIVSFTLPAVPFSILAGVYIDYLNKRLVLWVCNALRAIATALLVVALIWNHTAIFPLYILNFVISLITQFFMPAEESTIPMLVGQEELEAALALFNITLTLAQAVGFLILGQVIEAIMPTLHIVIGSARITLLPVDATFAIIAIIYALCAVLIVFIPPSATKGQKKHDSDAPLGRRAFSIIMRDTKESWHIIRKKHDLLVALLRVSLVSVLLLMIGQLAGPFVRNVLQLPVGDISFIFAPAGVSLVLGGIFIPHLAKKFGNKKLVAVGSFGTAIGLTLLGLTSLISPYLEASLQKIIVVGSVAFVIGLMLNMINIPAQTIMQEETPADARGRVFSFRNMFYNAVSIPVLLSAGVLADAASIQMVIYIAAVVLVLFQWWATRYRDT